MSLFKRPYSASRRRGMPSEAALSHTPREAINVKNVSVYASKASPPLLNTVSAHISRGTVTVLRGANGAGKTTLLRVLAGRTQPTTGQARIFGMRINERDPGFRRRVATMIGMPPLAPDLTVRDHVLLVATTWFSTSFEAQNATNQVLEEFELTALSARFPHELSSGQTQLFGLALIFVRPFDVLILDEPEQRLDPDHIASLAAAVLSRSQTGATCIIATHSDVLATLVSDRTIILETLREQLAPQHPHAPHCARCLEVSSATNHSRSGLPRVSHNDGGGVRLRSLRASNLARTH